MLSKFLIGQSISAYTKNDKIFEGNIFKNKDGEKVVLAEDGKWLPLTELKAIKQVGKKLNEENEQAIDAIIGKLSPEKVNAKSNEIDKIAKQVANAAGFSDNDSNRNDIEKYAQEQLVSLKAETDAKAGGNQAAMEKAMKDLKNIEKTPEEIAKENQKSTELNEAYNTNKAKLEAFNLQRERKQKFGEDAIYDFLDDDFENPEFEEDDEVYYDDGDFTYDASDDLYDDDFAAVPIDNTDYSEIDTLVDTEFEDALDDYEALGGDYSDEVMLESLATAFGGDAKKALKETKSIPDAVCHLADQVKALRKAELKK